MRPGSGRGVRFRNAATCDSLTSWTVMGPCGSQSQRSEEPRVCRDTFSWRSCRLQLLQKRGDRGVEQRPVFVLVNYRGCDAHGVSPCLAGLPGWRDRTDLCRVSHPVRADRTERTLHTRHNTARGIPSQNGRCGRRCNGAEFMFGNRSAAGELAVARLLTVTRTCQLQQIGVLAYLTTAIRCHRRRHAVVSLLPKRRTP